MRRAVETLGGGILGLIVGSFLCAPALAHVFGPATVKAFLARNTIAENAFGVGQAGAAVVEGRVAAGEEGGADQVELTYMLQERVRP